MTPAQLPLPSVRPSSLTDKLASYFRQRPNRWLDGRVLGRVAGAYAWRTRVSQLRRAPFWMSIENRQRHIEVSGRRFTISEYRFSTITGATEAGLGADGRDPSDAAPPRPRDSGGIAGNNSGGGE